MFHPTEHSYAKKKKSKILDLAIFISDRQKYGVDNVLDNDLCALISRIVYVQDREESTMFFGVSV